MCKCCVHQRWGTRNSSRLLTSFPFKGHFFCPFALITQKQLWVSQGGMNQGWFSVKVTRSWLVFPSFQVSDSVSGRAQRQASELTETLKCLGNDFACRKEPPCSHIELPKSPPGGPHKHTQKAARRTPTHLGSDLPQIGFSFMATTKVFSSLLMFGLISS